MALTSEQEKAKKKRNRRRKIAIALLALLMVGVKERVEESVQEWGDGEIGSKEFATGFLTELGSAHAMANYIGRNSAGSDVPFGQSDQIVGDTMIVDQARFMEGFAKDLEGGRYGEPAESADEEGTVMSKAILARADLYIERLRGTANDSVIYTLRSTDISDEGYVDWILDGSVKNHCGDCIAMAEGSPWPLDELKKLPGDGSTECGPNCKCELEYLGEIISF